MDENKPSSTHPLVRIEVEQKFQREQLMELKDEMKELRQELKPIFTYVCNSRFLMKAASYGLGVAASIGGIYALFS
jgi:hypothetical protein